MNQESEIRNQFFTKQIKKSNFCIGMKSALTVKTSDLWIGKTSALATNKVITTSEVGRLAGFSQAGLLIVLFIFLSFPLSIYAANECSFPPATFKAFICATIETILSPLIPILFGLALVVFLWGVARYVIRGANDEKERTQGKQIMLWGIIGLFVMVSVWGLVKIVGGAFGLENTTNPPKVSIPRIP
ncbi:MAG: hypothetical protein HYT28_03040 [Parcubacteria group bacterium]|nr:hypothetical protein [Parcubacteria group bacterium]